MIGIGAREKAPRPSRKRTGAPARRETGMGRTSAPINNELPTRFPRPQAGTNTGHTRD